MHGRRFFLRNEDPDFFSRNGFYMNQAYGTGKIDRLRLILYIYFVSKKWMYRDALKTLKGSSEY